MTVSTQYSILVIGWGSELRGDDAVGLVFVRRLEKSAPPGVEITEAPQLTPELAVDLAEAHRVIFVDAIPPGTEPEPGKPFIRRLEASRHAESNRLIPSCVHSLSPERLLELADVLYSARPEAWILGLPVASFDMGMELSPLARQGIDSALEIAAPYLLPPLTTNAVTESETATRLQPR